MNNTIAVALAVARKDLRAEWRTRELVPALAQFVVLALVIANFGFQIDARNAPTIAPGVLWMALVFAGLVAFGRTFAAEREQASLEAMLMTPASPVAIFAGKALGATLLLVGCEAVLLPALTLFFGTPLSFPIIATVLLATVGMAALGCLFAAMVADREFAAHPLDQGIEIAAAREIREEDCILLLHGFDRAFYLRKRKNLELFFNLGRDG